MVSLVKWHSYALKTGLLEVIIYYYYYYYYYY